MQKNNKPVSKTHLRANETPEHTVCRLLLEKKKTHNKHNQQNTDNNTQKHPNPKPQTINYQTNHSPPKKNTPNPHLQYYTHKQVTIYT